MAHVAEELLHFLNQRGWDGRVVGIEHLVDLQKAIHTGRDDGLIDEELYSECLNWFSFEPPESLPGASSIIIIAVPVPQMRVTFHSNAGSFPVIIPPTYVGYSATTERVTASVGDFLATKGHKVDKTALPLKTLAVRSGLADYGRNNICYVDGMGSFLQLVGCYSDLSCPGDSWREATMLERCRSCTACVRECPTAAIRDERFLLRAELCLTFHNERPGEFPQWIEASAHNCLIGCMRCQSVCPENKPHLARTEDTSEFSKEETTLMLERVPLAQLPVSMAQKFQSLKLNEQFENLCRNLSALLESGTSTTRGDQRNQHEGMSHRRKG